MIIIDIIAMIISLKIRCGRGGGVGVGMGEGWKKTVAYVDAASAAV